MSSSVCSHLCINETPFQSVRQPTTKTAITFPKNSRWTKQSFKDEADINVLMGRYLSTGEVPALNVVAPQYLDACGLDFQAMQNQVIEASELFMSIPSAIRARFGNDPAQFLDFVGNPENKAEMYKLGLLRPEYAPEPVEALKDPD